MSQPKQNGSPVKNKLRGKNADKSYTVFYTGRFSAEEFQKTAQRQKEMMNKAGKYGELTTGVWSNEAAHYMPGRLIKYNDPNQVPIPAPDYDGGFDIPDVITKASITYIELPRPRGGNSENNNCFPDILIKLFGAKLKYGTAEAFKRHFNIRVDEHVSMDKIPEIDDWLVKNHKCKLRIEGSDTYTRPINKQPNCSLEIKILLEGEHFTLKAENPRVMGVSTQERFMLMYRNVQKKKGSAVEAWDGKKFIKMTADEFKIENRNKNLKDAKYIMIPYDTSPQMRKFDIDTQRNMWIDGAEKIQKATNGRINMFRSGRDTITSKNDFFRRISHIIPDEIEQDEAIFLSESNHGPLTYGQKNFKGKVFSSDYCSRYPFIMSDVYKLYPIKRGNFRSVTEVLDKKDGFIHGIYRCKIDYDKKGEKLFNWDDGNYYTHVDVYKAIDLGLKVTLIQDGKPNYLQYDRDMLITGSQYFGDYVKFWFKLKSKGLAHGKSVINCLWGILCQRKTNYGISDQRLEKWVTLKDDEYVTKATVLNENQTQFTYGSHNKYFVTNHARVGTFITAYARTHIAREMAPYVDDIVRIHTDGYYSTKPPSKINTVKTLGALVFEGCSDVEIIHCNKVIGMDDLKENGMKNYRAYLEQQKKSSISI